MSDKPIGLENRSGTNRCYMNAALQALNACEDFREIIFDISKLSTNAEQMNVKIYEELVNQFFRLRQRTDSSANVETFRTEFVAKHRDFDNNSQHDSMEFLSFLVEDLYQATNTIASPAMIGTIWQTGSQTDAGLRYASTSEDAWNQYRTAENGSNLSDILEVQFEYIDVCVGQQQHRRVSWDFHPIVCVNIDEKQKGVSVQGYLDRYQTDEQTREQFQCPTCKSGVKTKTAIRRVPQILVIQLKIYRQRLINPETVINDKIVVNGEQLSLVAKVCHNGVGSLQSGHYRAVCKLDNVWYHIDDQHVIESSKRKKEVYDSDIVYMLFYRKTSKTGVAVEEEAEREPTSKRSPDSDSEIPSPKRIKGDQEEVRVESSDARVVNVELDELTPPGLSELSNSSYLVAAMHALCACEEIFIELRSMVKTKAKGKQFNHQTAPINFALLRLYESLRSDSYDFTAFELIRYRLVRLSDGKYSRFDLHEEHEPYIFITAFLNVARAEVNDRKFTYVKQSDPRSADQAWDQRLERDSSFYTSLFDGVHESGTKCKCEPSVPTRCYFHTLMLDIDTDNREPSVRALIDNIEDRDEQGVCPKCGGSRYEYSNRIARVPQILVLRLPVRLAHTVKVDQSVKICNKYLDLFAIIVRRQSGGYATVRKFEKDWYYCDAPVIARLARDQMRQFLATKDAHMLFYRKEVASRRSMSFSSALVARPLRSYSLEPIDRKARDVVQHELVRITDRCHFQLCVSDKNHVMVTAGNLSSVGQNLIYAYERPFGELGSPFEYPSIHSVFAANLLYFGGGNDLNIYAYYESVVHWAGVHVFLDRNGLLSMTATAFEPHIDIIAKYLFRRNPITLLTTLYPNQALNSAGELALGLQLPSDRAMRPRIAKYGPQSYCVCELSLSDVLAYRSNSSPSDSCFAIYVGKGAKLVVSDPYGERDHNRTLLNEGSVFVGDCDLEFRFFTHNRMRFQNIMSFFSADDQRLMDSIANPVFFLASNAAAFMLELEVTADGKWSAMLAIPEEGSFETIADWADGLERVVKLVDVDALHTSTVIMINDPKVSSKSKSKTDRKEVTEWRRNRRPIAFRWMPGFKRYRDSVVNVAESITQRVVTVAADPKSKYSSNQEFVDSEGKRYE